MSDTTLRHWMMLRHLPRHPRKIDAAKLVELLCNAGFVVSRRSVERDLVKLSSVFPVACDDQHKPFGWSWMKGAAAFDLPAMDVHSALAFRMAAEHLQPLLPEVTRSYLDPHFQRAQAVLDELDDNALSHWPGKVRVVPAGQALLPPAISRDVLENVQAALLAEKRLQLAYRKRGEAEPRAYLVHPQALVWRDAVGYLLASLKDYDDVLHFALHRMDAAQIVDEPRRSVAGFSLDHEIDRGSLGFLLGGEPVELRALFEAVAAVRVRETPLAADQTLQDQPDGRVLLTARVADTVQLRAWLRSFGEFVEVLGPPALRASLTETARALASRYLAAPQVTQPPSAAQGSL